jgi:8-oxoguanine deaminase
MTPPVDLVIRGARLLACFDDDGTELPGGWVAAADGVIVGIGPHDADPPEARTVVDARGCVVLPGLVNAHQHLYQNLTRAYAAAEQVASLTDWFWAYLTAWGRIDADAARGRRRRRSVPPVRGSMTLGAADGAICPEHLVEDLDTVLADCRRLVETYHDAAPSSLVRIGIGPSTLMSSSAEAMVESAAFADAFDVRLHSHVADDPDEDRYVRDRFGCRPLQVYEESGWLTDRTWFAHAIDPDEREIALLADRRVSVAHCPSMTMIDGGLPGGPPPIRAMLDRGVNVGIGCDGATAADRQSMWLETKMAMLLSRQREGRATAMSARAALRMATRGGAAVLGRSGEIGQLTVGANADVFPWRVDTLPYAGVLDDPITGLMQCGPAWAWHTIVGGRFVVLDGVPVTVDLATVLERHRAAALLVQHGV